MNLHSWDPQACYCQRLKNKEDSFGVCGAESYGQIRHFLSSLFIAVHRWLGSLFCLRPRQKGLMDFYHPKFIAIEKKMKFGQRYTAMDSDKTVPSPALKTAPIFLAIPGRSFLSRFPR